MDEQQTDLRIIDLYFARDEQAIAETDRHYGGLCMRISLGILDDRRDAEECVSDTYLKAWNAIPPTRPRSLRAFLSKIVRNVAVDKYRKSNASIRIPGELISSLEELATEIPVEESPDTALEFQELLRILDSYLRTLSKEDRTVFLSRYYCADSLQEIARMLGVSQRTVSRRLLTMRQGLRKRLEQEGYSV